MNEKKYLEEYDISKYERPSVAADMAVFTVVDRKQDLKSCILSSSGHTVQLTGIRGGESYHVRIFPL